MKKAKPEESPAGNIDLRGHSPDERCSLTIEKPRSVPDEKFKEYFSGCEMKKQASVAWSSPFLVTGRLEDVIASSRRFLKGSFGWDDDYIENMLGSDRFWNEFEFEDTQAKS